jgi:hypothetical protein
MTKNMGTIDRLARAFLIAPAATIAAYALAALVGVKTELGGLRDRDSVVSSALAERIAQELEIRKSA